MSAESVQHNASLRVGIAAFVAWLGMLAHNIADLPITVLSPENTIPGVVWLVVLGLWVRVRKWSTMLLFGWAALNLLGAVITVLPLTVLPFAPEQSARHYLFHALYAATQLPVLYLAFAELRTTRARDVVRG